jgi:hypothetical protein
LALISSVAAFILAVESRELLGGELSTLIFLIFFVLIDLFFLPSFVVCEVF